MAPGLLPRPLVLKLSKSYSDLEDDYVYKQTKVWLSLTLVLSLLALASACGKTEPAANEATPTTGATAYTPTGKEGTVDGVIAFTGTPPAPKKIDTSADPRAVRRIRT